MGTSITNILLSSPQKHVKISVAYRLLISACFSLVSLIDRSLRARAAIMCAKWLGDALTASESIHDAYIALHQFPHLDHKLNVPATNIAIRDVMAHELCVLGFRRVGDFC